MDDTTKVVLTVLVGPLLGALLGAVAAIFTTQYKLRKERDVDRDKERENIRLRILNPLLIAAEDLLGSIIDIERRRKDPKTAPDMIRWFAQVKELRHDRERFAFWANDEGYFAMSKLYVTGLYFYYAATIRRDLPFFGLTSDSEGSLLFHLSEVRVSIGGKFGIWEAMQDSLGAYLAQRTAVKNYRQFCEMVIDENEFPWLNRLIDFYREVHLKRDDHLGNIEDSLRRLSAFLRTNLKIPTITYQLKQEAILQLRARGEIPETTINDLDALTLRDEMSEVDFVAAVVECIGQELADDHKPSILKCAREPGIRPGRAV